MELLKKIAEWLKAAGINYEFGIWNSDVVYPYFVGEYIETEPQNEDGMLETTFILNGFTKNSWIELEQAKHQIEDIFPKSIVTDSGSGLAVFYAGAQMIPTEDMNIKRMQINLTCKEWRVK